MKRKNPETSIEAHNSLHQEYLSKIYKEIMAALGILGEATSEEIAAYLKRDHDKIWKRLSEMHKMELIYRPGKKKKLKSGRNGYTWMSCKPTTTEAQSFLNEYQREEPAPIPKPPFTQIKMHF